MVNAAIEAKVEVYIHSTLDDLSGLSGGKVHANFDFFVRAFCPEVACLSLVQFKLPHCVSKIRSIELANKSSIPVVVGFVAGSS